jgi:hypothetical protein
MLIAEWDDRLPRSLWLAYDGFADSSQRFRLNWDRVLTVSGDTITVEDEALRPIVFEGPTHAAPTGLHLELAAAGDGYDLRTLDNADVTEHFAPSGGVCCFLARVTDVYGNSVAVERNDSNRAITISPAARPPVRIGYDGAGKLQMITTELGFATFYWNAGKLASYTPPSQGGEYTFEYQTSGDVNALSRVIWPGGAAAEIGLNADGTVRSLGFPQYSCTITYNSSSLVTVVDNYGNTSLLEYTSGVLTRVADDDGIIVYSWLGRDLSGVTDKLGNVWSRSVNPRGHVGSESTPDGTTVMTSWNGDYAESSTQDGITTAYERNDQHRVRTETTVVGDQTYRVGYTWDENTGLMTSRTEMGVTFGFTWTPEDDRIDTIRKNGAVWAHVTYDDHRRTRTITTSSGTTTYGYASDSDLIPQTATFPNGTVATLNPNSGVNGGSLNVKAPGSATGKTLSLDFNSDGLPLSWQINGRTIGTIQY